MKYRHSHLFLFSFLPHPQESCLSSLNQSKARFAELGEYFQNMLSEAKLFRPRTKLHRISTKKEKKTRFARHKFAQLRTNYVRRTFFGFDKYPEVVFEANVCPIKNGLYKHRTTTKPSRHYSRQKRNPASGQRPDCCQ